MDHHGHHDPVTGPLVSGALVTAALLGIAVAAYLVGVLFLRRRGTTWPTSRTAAWVCGCLSVGAALVGPLAERAHHDFTVHMAGHVLLGMAGPFLLVLAAPVTLALRLLPVRKGRLLGRMLSSPPMAVLTDPFVAGLLNIGGLWVLYRGGLYEATHAEPLLHVLVHAHVLAAGHLFTFAVLGGPDPAPHRPSPSWRAAALVLGIAAHNILAKTIYAAQPEGVPAEQARAGAELMYYAGAPVEIALVFLVCRPWLLPGRGRDSAHGVARPQAP